MAMDKNDLLSLTKKVPNISASESLPENQKLIFLYLQCQERKKVLYRFSVQVETAIEFANQNDRIANDTADSQIKEATANMKSLKWEIAALNRLIADHIKNHGDLDDETKKELNLIP